MKFRLILLFFLLFYSFFPLLSNANLSDADLAIQNGDYERAHEILLPMAEEGNAEAQTIIGALFLGGHGVERDLEKGLEWIMKAANKGYEAARQRSLEINMDLAREGDAAAMYNVGHMCLNGWGGKIDAATCMGWLEEAVRSGHRRSARFLSWIYSRGEFGVMADSSKADHWSNVAKLLSD